MGRRLSRNPYVDLCLHLQAVRRQVEETRTPLASAVGVAATVYTHQVANVFRVLADVRVRHLLADEVGLGKTVQALMILNALRRQRPNVRALVIVPDRLVTQWRDELMTRAHTTPYETKVPGEGQYVRIAWEAQLRQDDADGASRLELSDIDPARYDVLIVDELHGLRSDLQDRIVRVSSEFEHVLVLTATPSFQRPESHAQLLSLLEPERTECARWDLAAAMPDLLVGGDLSKWPTWAAQRVVDDLLARDRAAAAAAPADDDSMTATAMAMCIYRRVIRTRRIDYPGVLPRRQHLPIVVEPLGAEIDRQSLMWRYFAQLDKLSTQFDPVALAKRVILSPPSLEQRIDFLRRRGHEIDGLLELAKPLVHKSNGDSRADALVDLLAKVWALDPEEPVLVAAQDNLTVDYLFDLVRARLPEVGPIGNRVPLVAARMRQGMDTEAIEDLGGFGNETSENVEAFQRGDAQVLFVPEAAQVGLNLQCARVLVLYSVPWKPEEVEQWIGRLDRIGNVAAFSKEGNARTIDVYTIAQRGLVDEKVVGVLQRFHAFERSVNLDGDHLSEVANAIEDAALRPDAVNWRMLEERAATMATEDAVQELNSALRPYLPWQPRWASMQRAYLDSMQPVAPVLGGPKEQAAVGPKAWDRAMEWMFKLLNKAGEYYVRSNADPETGTKFRTLWYRFGAAEMYGHRPVTARLVFGFGMDPMQERSPQHAHAFISRRADLQSRPRREVLLKVEQDIYRRPLHFVNFGDPLHDELVDGWAQAQPDQTAVDVRYSDDHALWIHAEPGWFLLRMWVLDAAEALDLQRTVARTAEAVAAVVTKSAPEQLPALVMPFQRSARCALEADVRWLRASLSGKAEMNARWRSTGEWQEVSAEAIAALVNPMAHGHHGLPPGLHLEPDELEKTADAEFARLRAGDKHGGEVWSGMLPAFCAQLRVRLRVVAEEVRDAVDLANRRLVRAEAALVDAQERGNRAQLTRAANLLDTAIDHVAMTTAYWAQRQAWLRSCEAAVIELRPRERLIAAIRARRLVI